jgi:four helix bundle protein
MTGDAQDGEMGRRGDGETGRWGDGEMGRWGDGEMGRRGDGEMGRWGDGEMGRWGEKFFILFESSTFEIVRCKFYLMNKFRSHRELDVYQLAFNTSMEIFKLTKKFPKDEVFSLTSQVRRSSRSVCANLAEAFRKRRYEKAFVAKLSDSEAEAAETQVWIDYMLECEYINTQHHEKLINQYENIIGKLINMIISPEKWSI